MYLDSPKESCGVVGVFGAADGDAALFAHIGLYALQHRGRDACGIAVNNNRDIEVHKNLGLVSEVFDNSTLSSLEGQMAVGHVMNSLGEEFGAESAQPIVSRYVKGNLTIAHNGAIVNAAEIKRRLELDGAIFQTGTDSEIIAYLIARERLNCGKVEDAVARILPQLRGAYALIVMSPQTMMAVRDPNGIKPLCMGRLNGMTVFASESCALEAMGAAFVQDLEPGVMQVVGQSDTRVITIDDERRKKGCVFEYIGLARPDSVIDGRSVYKWRFDAGRLLAKKCPVDVDIVTGVPDSGVDAAAGYSHESGISFANVFVMNGYVRVGFEPPKRSLKATSTGLKYNVLSPLVKDKRVLFIDDSIVRGITSAEIVGMLRARGAKEVHVRVISPKFRYKCAFGVEIPKFLERTAYDETHSVCALIGADSLEYLDLGDILSLMGKKCYCDACYTADFADA